jgi:hypothetical protein
MASAGGSGAGDGVKRESDPGSAKQPPAALARGASYPPGRGRMRDEMRRRKMRQVRKLQAEGRDHRVVAGGIPGAGKSFGKRAAGERSEERR